MKTSLGQPRGGTFLRVGFSGVPHRVGCREAELSTSAQPNCENDSGSHSSERMAAPPGEAVIEASISVSVVRTKLLDRLTGPLRRTNESTEEDARTSAQASDSRCDSPVCFGKRTNHGNDRRRFGADYQSQARFTGCFGSKRATDRFTIHFGGKRTTIQLPLRRRPNHRFNRHFGVNRIIETTSPCFGTD